MFRSIASRLTIWFLVIALVPCGVLTVALYYVSSCATHDFVRQHLLTLSETKANQLENFASERIRSISSQSRSPTLAVPTARLTGEQAKDPREFQAGREALRKILIDYAERYGHKNVMVFAPNGELLAGVQEDLEIGKNLQTGPLRDSELAHVVDRAKTLLQADMSDYQLYAGRKEPAAFAASPIFQAGVMVGVIVLELDNEEVLRVLSNYAGLGETGEVVVGSRVGDEVVVVAPLRHAPDAAFKARIPMGDSRAVALQHAVKGQRGYGLGTDYRDQPTAQVWTYLPSFRWGMVVKQDADEAFAVASRQRWIIGLLLGLTLVGVVITAPVVARSISRPVRAVVQVARSVADGDLTARLNVKATGETGQLVDSVQKMTDYLRGLIGKVQGSSVTLMSTATQIAATSRQQEAAMNEYGASTSEAAAAVKEISATSHELSRTVHEVNDVVSQTAAMASAGQSRLGRHGQDHAPAGRFHRLDQLQAIRHQRTCRQH